MNRNSHSPSGASEKIRVLLVDDSLLALTVLQRLLASAGDIEVVGAARNGPDAFRLAEDLRPTVICTDYHMPGMNGLQLVQAIMAKCPRPILVVSSSLRQDESRLAFDLLEAGAVDLFPKPMSVDAADLQKIALELAARIRVVARIPVFTRHLRSSSSSGRLQELTQLARSSPQNGAVSIVAIGASTGGPQAFAAILPRLPRNFPVPILCVQHISDGFVAGMVDWLAKECRLDIRVAADGEMVQGGTVYFPPDRHHLEIEKTKRLRLTPGPTVDGHCPSVTTLFCSVADNFGPTALAVILTGMGSDGARGLLAVSQAGGYTIAQDEASCVVYGMPKQAVEMGAVRKISPLDRIAETIVAQVDSLKTDFYNI